MPNRLPLVLSATALAVAVLGVTPGLNAATTTVKKALFANNAGAVNGIKASKTPAANQLLPLDATGKFPKSVLGQGLVGPQGPPGPQGQRGAAGTPGTPGTPGPSNAILRTRATAPVNLPTAAATLTTVITAQDVPAGTYVVLYRGDIAAYDGSSVNAYVRCQIEAPAATVIAGATAYAHSDPDAPATIAQMTIADTLDLATATTVRVRCLHDTPVAIAPYIENNRLLFIHVGSVDKAAVTS